MGDAAIAKGMAGSRKCFDIFELPQRRVLSGSSEPRGGEEFARILRLRRVEER